MIAAQNITVLAAALALGLTACGGRDAEAPPAAAPETNPPAQEPSSPSDVPPTGASAGSLDQGPSAGATTGTPLAPEQILGITSAVDSSVIARAQIVQPRAKNSKVKSFADMLVKDHLDHKNKQAELAQKLQLAPAETPTSQRLTEDAARLADTLKARQGADLDRAYIEVEVREHLSLLDLLDTKLIPSAQNPDLRSSLQDHRGKVEAHLRQAQDIQKDLAADR